MRLAQALDTRRSVRWVTHLAHHNKCHPLCGGRTVSTWSGGRTGWREWLCRLLITGMGDHSLPLPVVEFESDGDANQFKGDLPEVCGHVVQEAHAYYPIRRCN